MVSWRANAQSCNYYTQSCSNAAYQYLNTSASGFASLVGGDPNNCTSGYGVYGAVASSNNSPAVYGYSANTTTQGVAVEGEVDGAGNGVAAINDSSGYGLYAWSGSGTAVDAVAYSSCTAPATCYGVNASSPGTAINAHGTTGAGVISQGAVGVQGTGNLYYGVSGFANDSFPGVYGQGSDDGVDGYGLTQNGVYGTTDATDTNYSGVLGVADNVTGVYGYSSNNGAGVVGRSVNMDGVQGYSASASNSGVYANNSNNGYGIYATAGSGYAGYFTGQVYVSGYLWKSGGGFLIDHPLDPANRYLYHSFVESPEMKNVYDGVATLDANGEAVVAMPDYFQAENAEYRYQLTPIGRFAPVYVADEISNNQFKIAGGAPGQRISWQVTGVRMDSYAKGHPFVAEVDKAAGERGKYLHPQEVAGLVPSAGTQIRWMEPPKAWSPPPRRTAVRFGVCQ